MADRTSREAQKRMVFAFIEKQLKEGASDAAIKYKVEKVYGFNGEKMLQKVKDLIDELKMELPQEKEEKKA